MTDVPPAPVEPELDADALARWWRADGTHTHALPAVMERVKALVLADAGRAEQLSAMVLRLAEQSRDPALAARALSVRAHALSAVNRFEEADAALARAATLAKSAGAIPELAGVLLVSVQSRARVGDLPGALHAAEEAGALFASIADTVGAAKAAVNAGVVRRQLNDPEGALAAFDRARPAFAQAPAVLAQIDSNAAEALLELDRFADAEAAFRAALERFRAAGIHHAAAVAEGNLADLLGRQGRLDESLVHFEHAIRAFEGGSSPGDLARLRTERAEVYALLGLWDHAAADLDAAMADLRARDMKPELARALAGRAAVHAELAQHHQAAARLDECVAALGAAGQTGPLLRVHALRAALHADAGEHTSAASTARDALRLATARPAEQARLLLVLARCLIAAGQAPEAVEPASRALHTAHELGLNPVIAQALHVRALARLLAPGHAAEAINDLLAALDTLDRTRGSLPGELSRVAFAARHEQVYEDAAYALLYAGAAADPHRAFDTIERARCRALLDAVRGDLRTPTHADDPHPALGAEHRELLAHLNALYARAESNPFDAPPRDSRPSRRERLQQAEQRLASLEVRLASTRRYRGIFARPASAAVAAASLSQGEVIVQHAVIRAQLVAFVLGPEGVRAHVPLGDARSVAEPAERFQFQIGRWLARQAPGPRAPSPALVHAAERELRHLGERLLDPLAPLLDDAEHVVFSPAPPSHAVPFEALIGSSGRLLERAAVSYTPSASVLVDLRAARAVHPSRNDSLLVVGAADDNAPWIADEARAVAAAHPGATLLLDSDATAQRFLDLAPAASRIHIACHALAPDSSLFSARLRLADRWISAREIAETRLAAAAVVLTGCDTGTGVNAGSGELFGLVRAFLVAGASVVTATRWPVHDRLTTSIISRAYELSHHAPGLLRGLRAAQLEAARAGWHPATWAPFVTMGTPS